MSRKKYDLEAYVYDKRGRLLTKATNSYSKTHPMQARLAKKYGRSKEQIFLHAEIAALIKLKDWSKAHRVKIVRHLKNGKTACAKPCSICEAALKEAGIKIIEHT